MNNRLVQHVKGGELHEGQACFRLKSFVDSIDYTLNEFISAGYNERG